MFWIIPQAVAQTGRHLRHQAHGQNQADIQQLQWLFLKHGGQEAVGAIARVVLAAAQVEAVLIRFDGFSYPA